MKTSQSVETLEVGEKFTWTPQRLTLLELLADVTDPRTKAKKAEEAGISGTYASTISRHPAFIEALTKRVREVVKSELPAIYDALIAKAKDGDVQAARTVLQAAGEIQTGAQVSVSTTVNTSAEELEGRLSEHHKNRFANLISEN